VGRARYSAPREFEVPGVPPAVRRVPIAGLAVVVPNTRRSKNRLMTSNEMTSEVAAIDRLIAWVTAIAEAIDESAATASEVVDDAA
jgi:hypothetical protein